MTDDRIIAVGLCFLGIVAVVLATGLVLLAVQAKELPPSLAGALGTCLGALGGLLPGSNRPR